MNKPDPIVLDPARARPVRPRGRRGPSDGRWYWRAEVGPRTVWTGWGTRDEVRRILAQQIADGSLGASAARPEGIRTVAELLQRWLPAFRRRGRRPRTVVAYEGGAKRLIDSELGELRLERLSSHALQTWVDGARIRYAPQTVALDLQVLASAWRWGRSVGAIERSLPEVDLGHVAPIRDKHTPTTAEARAVLEALSEVAPPWARLLIEVQLATGARIGELADLTWDGLRPRAGLLVLQGKTGRREVPLPEHLLAQLEAQRTTGRWVFGIRPASARGVGRYLRRACERAGVRPFTTHALRRLAVDRLARAGVDVATAAALLGHSPAVMLQRYRQVSDADRRRAMASARLWDLGSGEAPGPHKVPHNKNYN